jgi:quercetin dioxygenase-like cupin family protein
MVQSTDIFARAKDGVWEPTPEGNKRRVVLYTNEMMVVEFAFEEGGEGWLHSHPHVQSSYVAEGAFDVTIDGRTERLNAGDCYIVPSGLQHGVKLWQKAGWWTASPRTAPIS